MFVETPLMLWFFHCQTICLISYKNTPGSHRSATLSRWHRFMISLCCSLHLRVWLQPVWLFLYILFSFFLKTRGRCISQGLLFGVSGLTDLCPLIIFSYNYSRVSVSPKQKRVHCGILYIFYFIFYFLYFFLSLIQKDRWCNKRRVWKKTKKNNKKNR